MRITIDAMRLPFFKEMGSEFEDSAAWQSQAAEVLTQQTQQVSRFADWLRQHAGLVKHLGIQQLRFPARIAQSSKHLIQQSEEAEQLLAAALQAAAAVAVGPATAAAAAVLPLRLHSFAGSRLFTAVLLQALPAAALTRVLLMGSASGLDTNSSSAAAALTRLSNLRELTLFDGTCGLIKDTCLTAVGQLKRLTKLQLSKAADTCSFQLLPQQLQQLWMSMKGDVDHATGGSGGSAQPSLAHLSALQLLHLHTAAAACRLPASLTSLFSQLPYRFSSRPLAASLLASIAAAAAPRSHIPTCASNVGRGRRRATCDGDCAVIADTPCTAPLPHACGFLYFATLALPRHQKHQHQR
jgi:hypothetical protein